MQIQKKLATLSTIANILNKNDVLWAVGASAMLYFVNAVDNFNDFDIMVAEDDAQKVVALLSNLGKCNSYEPTAKYKTKAFFEFNIDGVEFDIIAGFTIVNNNQDYYFPLKKEDITQYIIINDESIPLHSPAMWRLYYSLMNRNEKVCIIDEYIKRK